MNLRVSCENGEDCGPDEDEEDDDEDGGLVERDLTRGLPKELPVATVGWSEPEV